MFRNDNCSTCKKRPRETGSNWTSPSCKECNQAHRDSVFECGQVCRQLADGAITQKAAQFKIKEIRSKAAKVYGYDPEEFHKHTVETYSSIFKEKEVSHGV